MASRTGMCFRHTSGTYLTSFSSVAYKVLLKDTLAGHLNKHIGSQIKLHIALSGCRLAPLLAVNVCVHG